jgi:hypothetical protein
LSNPLNAGAETHNGTGLGVIAKPLASGDFPDFRNLKAARGNLERALTVAARMGAYNPAIGACL